MQSLTVVLIIIGLFIFLAVRNWNRAIGAGPTILIVMAIVLSAFGAVRYNDYQRQLRDFDTCTDRVSRSQDSNLFNRTLVSIIEREFPDRPDVGQELRTVLIDPLSIEICGDEPKFLVPFEGDENARR